MNGNPTYSITDPVPGDSFLLISLKKDNMLAEISYIEFLCWINYTITFFADIVPDITPKCGCKLFFIQNVLNMDMKVKREENTTILFLDNPEIEETICLAIKTKEMPDEQVMKAIRQEETYKKQAICILSTRSYKTMNYVQDIINRYLESGDINKKVVLYIK